MGEMLPESSVATATAKSAGMEQEEAGWDSSFLLHVDASHGPNSTEICPARESG